MFFFIVIVHCHCDWSDKDMGKQKPEAISTYNSALLARLVNFLTSLAIAREQRKLLMKSFMESQFGYFPLKWMF